MVMSIEYNIDMLGLFGIKLIFVLHYEYNQYLKIQPKCLVKVTIL